MKTEQEVAYYTTLPVVRLIDKQLTTKSAHYYDKSGQFLFTLDQVITAFMEDNLQMDQAVNNQCGVMYPNQRHLPTQTAIYQALRLFKTSLYTRDHTPQEIRLNPTEINGLPKQIEGAVIISDNDVRRGFIRVCTATPKEDDDAKFDA